MASISHDEFLQDYSDEGIEISHNIFSLSYFLKTFYYTNSSMIFLASLINFFRDLDSINDLSFEYSEELVPYVSYSHAFTTYCLKMLAKRGIVEIVHCEEEGKCDLICEYRSIGNNKNSKVNMYTVKFYKLRDLTLEDVPLVVKMAKIMGIEPNNLKFSSVGGVLAVEISMRGLLRSLACGIPFKAVHRHFTTFRESLKNEELKEMIKERTAK